MSRCKSCHAEIVWAETIGGKSSPFQRDDAGEWVIEDGKARHVGKAPEQLELGAPPPAQRWTSHFATCPQAGAWRKK